MDAKPLSLEHKDLLEPKFKALELCLSEYSFASRFLFRREHNYHVAFDGPRVWLKGKMKEGLSYLMPTEDVRKIPTEILKAALAKVDCLYPIPESWISSFAPPHFQTSYNRDDSDYLFK